MSKLHDEFIKTYKELENIIDMSVREYEDSLNDIDSQKLRLCRILRNYIQHNDDYDKYVSITPYMQEFLKSILYKEQIKYGTAKEHMISLAKYGVLSMSDNVAITLALLMKKGRDQTFVIDDKSENVYIVTKSMIADGIINGVTKNTKLHKLPLIKVDYEIVEASCPLVNVNSDEHAIIFVSTKPGKIIGILNRS